MKDLASLPSKFSDDVNQQQLQKVLGSTLPKLTPKQRQLVVEILSELKPVAMLG